MHFVDGGDLRIAWLPIKYTTGGYSGPPLPGDRIVKSDARLKTTWPSLRMPLSGLTQNAGRVGPVGFDTLDSLR